MNETTASHLSIYSAFVEVAASALGGKKEGPGPITEDLSQASPEQFAARVDQLLSF